MIAKDKLQRWIEQERNVLLEGRHGVGKSSIVKQAFNEAGLTWKYFSSSTMDPWVDFLGVPKEQEVEGEENYLKLVRPKGFAHDEVEALFFDEFNRAHSKVRNAVMQLLQFQSVNDKEFENLQIIWAAINPDEEGELGYDVDPLDPAQKDRFHIHIQVPYQLNQSYFADKFGNLSRPAIEWWNQLEEGVQERVSPRRLDYALEEHRNQGSIRDVLPPACNPGELIDRLETGSVEARLKTLYESGDKEAIREYFRDENQYRASVDLVFDEPRFVEAFLPYFPPEKIANLIVERDPALRFVLSAGDEYPLFEEILEHICQTTSDHNVKSRILYRWHQQNKHPGVEISFDEDGEHFFFDFEAPSLDFDGSNGADLGDYRNSINWARSVMERSGSATHQRRDAVSTLIDDMPCPSRLTDSDLKDLFEVVSTFASRSQTSTLRGVDQLGRFVNTLIHQTLTTAEDESPGRIIRNLLLEFEQISDFHQVIDCGLYRLFDQDVSRHK